MDKHIAVASSFIRDTENELENLPTGRLEGDAQLLASVERHVKREILPNLQRAVKNLEAAAPGQEKDALLFKAIVLESAAHQYRGDAICHYYNDSRRSEARDHYRSAVEVLERLTSQFADQQNAWFLLGVAKEKINDKAGTLAALEKAIDLDPTSETGIEAEKLRQVVQERKEGCFIATACYGTYSHPDVQFLRDWRDEVLLRSKIGNWLVSLYYTLSPILARRLSAQPAVSRFVRNWFLQPLVLMLRQIHR